MNYLRPELLDRLAREYALGTLSGAARRRFESVLRQAHSAQQAVAAWHERLAPLADAVPRLEPRAAAWQAIERRLFGDPAGKTAAGSARSGRRGFWAALFSGRAWAGALAGALLCVVVLREQPHWAGLETYRESLPHSYVGLLVDNAGKPTLLASSRRHGRQLDVKMLLPLAVPPGQVAQLWALPRDGSAAFPVDVVPAQGSARIMLVDRSERLFFSVAQLAVSFEAAPAKAGDRPGGAFVLSGHCVKLW